MLYVIQKREAHALEPSSLSVCHLHSTFFVLRLVLFSTGASKDTSTQTWRLFFHPHCEQENVCSAEPIPLSSSVIDCKQERSDV